MFLAKLKQRPTLDKVLPYLLIVLGLIGFICAFIIMYEDVKLMQNADYRPSCSINPIISCGSVMQSKQSHVFGFPNPMIGLAAFPMVITFGVLLLGGATKLRRWVWLCLQAGTVLALIFVHWLFFESVFRIHALCPYCMVVWATTIALFWYTLLYNLRTGAITVTAKFNRAILFLQQHHADILVSWYLVIILLILHHFWYYFKTIL
jgi:uncharacterized membrane protein